MHACKHIKDKQFCVWATGHSFSSVHVYQLCFHFCCVISILLLHFFYKGKDFFFFFKKSPIFNTIVYLWGGVYGSSWNLVTILGLFLLKNSGTCTFRAKYSIKKSSK